ncbi:hypothetical protein [Pararhizobium haloflavum]|uniref:hypothetical protein n=1 Tax=Pararhizobium haloflavum TaxID=2037914 RepID=UPI000C17C7E3|nr:hypothetical protein [Pararhizobium haloflavum]
MAPKQEADKAGTIPIAQAARLLMISEERVRQLCKMDYIPRIARGKVTLVGAVQGYIRFLKDEERRSSKSATATRMQDAKATEIDLRIRERLRQLVPIEDAQAAFDIVLGKVREEFDGMPARTTRDMELRRKLEAEVNDSLKRIAKAIAASAEFFEKGGELPSTGSPDDT